MDNYVFGRNNVIELLKEGNRSVSKLILMKNMKDNSKIDQILDLARERGIIFQFLPKEKFIDKYKSSPGYTNSGCAITKLTHNILGYPDNWVVLNCFRSFREDFLKKHEEYIGILVEYDYLSPFISREIDKLDNKEIFALNILKNYLLPMANYINNNLFNEAINTYQEMISYFKNIFNLENIEIVRPNKLDMNTLGKGRVRVKTN